MKSPRLLAGFLVTLSLWALPSQHPSTQTAPPTPAALVVFREQPLFSVKTRVGSFTPEARAQAIVERLDRVASDPFHPLPPLQAVSQEASTDIVAAIPCS